MSLDMGLIPKIDNKLVVLFRLGTQSALPTFQYNMMFHGDGPAIGPGILHPRPDWNR